ncbi:MAG: sugar phosphate isomerase/epimerase [Chloroflexi bacterium]|nr:sugar phosphate isomerase/epimerase [Chloroflexota bacterium]MCL5107855.1 sugar phosphate isomerase/epimerase [Chloroflexota bacterium]
MRLSLSVRVAESFQDKARLSIPFSELLEVARTSGYEGICLRASVVSITSLPEQVREVASLVGLSGLTVSMVTGDIDLAANNERAPDALRNITSYLDLAETLGTKRVRVMMHHEDDIPFAQRAADEANERGLLLCHQIHTGTLFERVGECLDLLGRINRRNFGITYEPANLLAVGEDYGPEQVKALGETIFNVYLQNYRLDPNGTTRVKTRRGPLPVTPVPLSDKSGVNLDRVFAGLVEIGYEGWVTVHSAALSDRPVQEWVREYYGVLRPYVG